MKPYVFCKNNQYNYMVKTFDHFIKTRSFDSKKRILIK